MPEKDKLVSNPNVPSLFDAPPEGGRNFRSKKDPSGMANRVGKQWENMPQKELVPLPESPTTKAKPKIANLPGVYNKNAPTLFGAAPQVGEKPKVGKLNVNKNAGGEAPSLFSGSNNYFAKATGSDQK